MRTDVDKCKNPVRQNGLDADGRPELYEDTKTRLRQ